MTTLSIEQLRDRINNYVARRAHIKDTLSKQLTSVQLQAEINNLEQLLEDIEGQSADFEGQVTNVVQLAGTDEWAVHVDVGISNISNSTISFYPDTAAAPKGYFHAPT